MTKLNIYTRAFIILVLCTTGAVASPGQIFKTLVTFDGANGAQPAETSLVQGTDGNLYGTTSAGSSSQCVSGCGTLFKITPGGRLTTLYAFCSQKFCTDGAQPFGSLVEGTDGNFYGTTSVGGANSQGTVFKITPRGELTTLYSFCAQTNCADGTTPSAGLIQATDGNFYGTTASGGDYAFCPPDGAGCGTVFRITPGGTLTTLYTFCNQQNCPDGYFPNAGLVQAANGNLYGTTVLGGSNGNDKGTVFKITPAGKLTTLYSFCSQTNCADGGRPYAGLVQATDADLYGTTIGGGTTNDGTFFKITPAGKLTTLYSFCPQNNCADGASPQAGLVQATDGNFYGTTAAGGGATGRGTIFKITPAGKITTLYSFCSQSGCADGVSPNGLGQDTNGTFYGTTNEGGASGNCNAGCGTLFSLSVGLRPFVETRPTSGKVGAKVIILGSNLTGATSVTFNGTPAKFKVISNSEIKTTVPHGATTGEVIVTTPRRKLSSNVPFRVTK